MKVLVACEYSGRVATAFGKLGHAVTSADLLPTEGDTRWYRHHQGDVRDLLDDRWDLIVAHPPCTYLTNAGARWLYRNDGGASGRLRVREESRWGLMLEAAMFFRQFLYADCPRVAVENPVMVGHAKRLLGRDGEPVEPTQVVQPWMFGHMEVKATCLWLKGLPSLVPTEDVRERMLAETTYAQRAKVHHASPGPERWKLRSLTYQGLADAMALQWGSDW